MKNYIYITMKNYVRLAFEYNNDVTYYVITCKSAFDWVYANNGTYLSVDTGVTNNLLEAGCTNKLCPFQYNLLEAGCTNKLCPFQYNNIQ